MKERLYEIWHEMTHNIVLTDWYSDGTMSIIGWFLLLGIIVGVILAILSLIENIKEEEDTTFPIIVLLFSPFLGVLLGAALWIFLPITIAIMTFVLFVKGIIGIVKLLYKLKKHKQINTEK